MMMGNNFWCGKRALYILISLIVEDLSACVHVVTGFQCKFGRLALTRLIPMAMLVIISAS
jgi:hypothetical protein